jgi:acyl-CoA synthetase (AMP-forming)/AMP-acid ligase II
VRIILWRGYHSAKAASLIRSAWLQNDLLILYPPGGNDTSFLSLLPEGEIFWEGDWDPEERSLPDGTRVGGASYSQMPSFGIFSTGTLGQKLVLYSKKNIESSLNAILSLFEEARIDSVFCYPQPFHTFGLVLGYLHCLLKDKKLIAPVGPYNALSHSRWREELSENVMTLGTPTHFKDLVQAQEGKSQVRPTYTAIVGAAKVSVSLWQDLRTKLKIENPSVGYGATEASPGITHLPPGQEPKEDGEVGFALPHLKVELKEGEGVLFSGPSVCLAILQGGVLHFPHEILIEDNLKVRSDGVLIYQGRTGLLLNRGGEKFSLEQLESSLKERLQVEALCVSVPDERLGEELGIVARAPAEKTSIYKFLKEEFLRDFNPQYFTSVSDLPVNASAKLDRFQGLHLLQSSLT